MSAIKCPKCGNFAVETITKYGIRNTCEPCGLWSWDNKPLVDKATHEARKKAHTVFDSLWKNKHISRSKAYKLLSEKMKLTPIECHISLFNVEQCSLAMKASRNIFLELKGNKS